MTLSAFSSCSSSRSSLITLLVATTALSTGAFTAPRVALPSLSATKLSGTKDSINDAEVSRILNAGGGIPVVPAGDCLLWDPAIEGKLGGSGQLEARLSQGSRYDDSFVADTFLETSPADILPVEAQCWLEDLGVPQNFAKPTAPVTATVLGRTPVIQPDAPGDIQHILMRLPEGMHYVEGQSISVIPPGLDAKGKPHKPRLYSIASTRYGDLLDGRTVSLCVRRAEYYDPATKQPDPTKKGICSNYLCDIMPGSKVKVAGPVGKTMLLPEDDPSKDIIMVATGTGIAPFRAFLRRLFLEETIARHAFTGNAWLILGVPTTSGLLYPQEIAEMEQNARPGQLKIDYAISREMTNAQGGKLYVQDVLAQQADVLLEKLENGAVIYFCGLKGMMPGILESLESVCVAKGIDFGTKLKEWQSNHQWHVEVY